MQPDDTVLLGAWMLDDALNMAVIDCAVAACCCPCVYGAGLRRHCSAPPTQPQPVCDCTLWCCVGSLLPPLTGVVVRARQARGPLCSVSGASAVAHAVVLETCCCLCGGAPCAMNDYRAEVPLNVGRLLLEQPDEVVPVDTYIASPPVIMQARPQSMPCSTGWSQGTVRAAFPSPIMANEVHRRPASAVATSGSSTADPCTRL